MARLIEGLTSTAGPAEDVLLKDGQLVSSVLLLLQLNFKSHKND